jgi:transcriptional regulator with XRE-family HTH domain
VIIFRNLGRALRLLRERRGHTQKQAAEISGITPPMLSAYENDRTSPEIESLDKLLRGLDASLSDLDWALRRVSPHRETRDATGPAPGIGRLGGDAGTRAALEELIAQQEGALQPLPAALREGYAEILHGLVRVSRYVVESAAQAPTTTAPPAAGTATSEGEGEGPRQR